MTSITPYYADEYTTLWLGDCLEVMSDLTDGSVGTVLTDPPYSSGGRRENARSVRRSMIPTVEDEQWIRGDAMSTNGFLYLMRVVGLEWRRVLTPGAHALSFIDWRMAHHLAGALESADLRQHPTLVWDKVNMGLGSVFRNRHEFIVHMSAGNPRPPRRRDTPNVLTHKAIRGGEHPTEKPVPLLVQLLDVVAHDSLPVLDPFAGSGTTLLAARELGLPSIGIEADERYAEVAARRLEAQAGQLPLTVAHRADNGEGEP